MAEYQSQPELSEEEIKELAKDYWKKYSALEKLEENETKKKEGREKLFRELYEKCDRNDNILMAIGIEMVEFYKVDNKNKEREINDGELDIEFTQRPGHNFISNFPGSLNRVNLFPGGQLFGIFKDRGKISDLGFRKGGSFFHDILKIRIWHNMDEFGEQQEIDLVKIGKRSGCAVKNTTYQDEELLKLGLKKVYVYLRRMGYTKRDLQS